MQTDVLATSRRRMYLLKDKTYQIENNDRCKALICHWLNNKDYKIIEKYDMSLTQSIYFPFWSQEFKEFI